MYVNLCRNRFKVFRGNHKKSLAEEADEESTSSPAVQCVYRFHLVMKFSHAYKLSINISLYLLAAHTIYNCVCILWIVVNISAITLKNKVLHWKKNTLRLRTPIFDNRWSSFNTRLMIYDILQLLLVYVEFNLTAPTIKYRVRQFLS